MSPFSVSILKRAQMEHKVNFEIIDIREFATDKHHQTDSRPFGGGAGMVMLVEPIDLALQSATASPANRKVLLTSAKGKMFNQDLAKEYSQLEELVIICGHYEGVDERVAEHLADEEIRIGDYVLTGGEPAAAVIADSVARLLPGVLGNETSLEDESHAVPGELGYPQYTRPQDYKGWKVPEVLTSGHHEEIQKWRQSQEKSD